MISSWSCEQLERAVDARAADRPLAAAGAAERVLDLQRAQRAVLRARAARSACRAPPPCDDPRAVGPPARDRPTRPDAASTLSKHNSAAGLHEIENKSHSMVESLRTGCVADRPSRSSTESLPRDIRPPLVLSAARASPRLASPLRSPVAAPPPPRPPARARSLAVGAENEYANVISQIGGKYVAVTAIESNPNTDPHTFEASPSVAQVGRRRAARRPERRRLRHAT